ncbi:MAG TPA: hypothetical protein VH040_07010 [Usitatibacter sp.]|nr:hypothetical protein [Usitatibacter sp.]
MSSVISDEEWKAVESLRLGGRTFRFHRREATVLEGQRWSDTHIASSGGQSYLHKGTGIFHAPQVQSHVQQRAEYWLRMDDDRELALDVDGDLHCRAGHELTLVVAIPKGQSSGHFLLAYNHQTGTTAEIHGTYGWFVQEYKIGANQRAWWLGTAVVMALVAPVVYFLASGLRLQQAVAGAVSNPTSRPIMFGGLLVGAFVGVFVAQVAPLVVNLPRITRLRKHLGRIGRVLKRQDRGKLSVGR